LIVIHITDGQPRTDRCVSRFQQAKTQASPHFVVGRAGEVVQLVKIEDRAWHDSGRNGVSVGIEHVARTPGELGPDDAGLPLTEEQLAASAALVAWLLGHLGLGLDAVVGHYTNSETSHHDCGLGDDATTGGGRRGIWPWERYRRMIEQEQKKHA
jgi:N-acetyl-anhydromuramyl-L-alanine amidase AmpD